MRLSVWALILAFLSAPTSAQSKNPWEWTIEERIAARLDDKKMAERHAAQLEDVKPLRVLVAGESAPSGFVIEGKRNPELFMPFELMTRLLMALREDAYGADLRRLFTPDITAHGWKAEEFWKTFREIGGNWAALAAKSERLQKDADRAAPARRRELEAEAAALGIPMCRARAEALREARVHFGVAFDRFLYSVLTRNLTISSGKFAADEAARLRYVEGGCH